MQVLKSAGAPRALPKIPPPARPVPRAERTPVSVDIRLSHQGQAIAAHTRDLSTTGFFVVTAVKFDIGAELDGEVAIPAVDGLSERTFATRAKIVRRDLSGYGAVFIDPPAELAAAIAALGAR
ncbi:MAG: PilZ domain-containing protein [Deltaproteobacteria bacterium]|nr:PilZ domain-containing protein [Deltaproteobacteria bacterium]